MRTVFRNPFARHTITAERVPANGQTCAWCGSVRKSMKYRRGWLQRFYVEPDTGRTSPIADGRLFCSRGCCESFTGQEFDQ